MDKINEAKKSELIRKENTLEKLATELANKRTILNSDTKEFNKIIDTSTKTLKKEQDKFSAEHRAKTKALAEEQKRLDIRARTITSLKENLKKLHEEYSIGVKANENTEKVLTEKLKDYASDRATLESNKEELVSKNKELKEIEDKIAARQIAIGNLQDGVSKQKSLNGIEYIRLQNLETKLEDDRTELTLLKAKCSQDAIVNKNTENELQRTNTTIE